MDTVKKGPYAHPGWKGYTVDELKYRRAYIQARLEISKARILSQVSGLDTRKRQTGVALRSMSVVNIIKYAEYGLMAFNAVKRITGLFKKRH